MNKKDKIIVTQRREPVRVVIPYEKYERSKRLEGYKKILEVREALQKAGVKAKDVYKESKRQLEEKS